jgi:hypothetical protein
MPEREGEARPLPMDPPNCDLPETVVIVQGRKILGPEQSSRGFFIYGQGIGVQFGYGFEGHEIHAESI